MCSLVDGARADEETCDILIGSGFAPTIYTQQAETMMNLKSVDGSSLAHRDFRDVLFEFKAADGAQRATMKFQVAGMARPVASVGELLNKVFRCTLQMARVERPRTAELCNSPGGTTGSRCRSLQLGKTAQGSRP